MVISDEVCNFDIVIGNVQADYIYKLIITRESISNRRKFDENTCILRIEAIIGSEMDIGQVNVCKKIYVIVN